MRNKPLKPLGKIIASGLGESVSAVPPAEPDTIEVSSDHAPQIHEEKQVYQQMPLKPYL